MDLKPIDTPPTADELAALVDFPQRPAERPGASRHLLLPALHALQRRVGWISPGGLGEICRRLHLPPAEAYGVASFYAWFSTTPRSPRVVHLCDDLACRARGAEALCASVAAAHGPAGHGDGVSWHRSPCLGLCESAPAALLQASGPSPRDVAWGEATAAQVAAVFAGEAPPVWASERAQGDRLLRRVGRVDPTSYAAYVASGGGRALALARARGAAWVRAEVTASGLVGRGGAAFPTGRKWTAVAEQPVTTRWLVCNADESEPGTFKDRFLLEQDPFAVVEALAIAAFATGCAQGIVYLRAEYPLAAERLANAIAQAETAGMVGPDAFGPGLGFALSIVRGAGAYICGEETALLESIEGKRGEPRAKPPYPVAVGLFGLPTVINNVETLANVPDLLLEGAEAYRAIGTPTSPGTRLFCVSGQVASPGLIEAPMGVTVRALIERCGGAPRGVGAVLLGGAAGTFLPASRLDLPLAFDTVRQAGATMGSGVVLVLGADEPLMPYLQRIARFFRDESCGQCVPCRVGTVRQEEWLARAAVTAPGPAERVLLDELGSCLRDASICGLGQTANAAIASALVAFPERFGAPSEGA